MQIDLATIMLGLLKPVKRGLAFHKTCVRMKRKSEFDRQMLKETSMSATCGIAQ